MTETVTIVLAAGKGVRLGGPKALLMWPGKGNAPARPLAIAHAEARLAAESKRVVVVTRAPVMGALLPYVRPGVDLLVSDADDDLGPAGSIAAASARVNDGDRVIVCPVDTLPARAETVAQLLARLGKDGAPPLAVRPRHEGRGGHPVVLQGRALARYRQADPPPLRDHLRALGAGCVDEEVADADVTVDLDRPADVMRVLRAPPTFLGRS